MKTKKWTIIDTIIVIVAAAAVAVVWTMFGPDLADKSTNEKISFTVMIQDREKGLADAMSEGDRVTLSLTEKDGGVIQSVRKETAVNMVYDSIQGEYRNVENEEHEDIYVRVEADCKVSDKAITTGGTKIKVGQEIPVRGKGYAANGYVIEIED